MHDTVPASRRSNKATIRSTVRSKSARSMIPLCACVERVGTRTVVTGAPPSFNLIFKPRNEIELEWDEMAVNR